MIFDVVSVTIKQSSFLMVSTWKEPAPWSFNQLVGRLGHPDSAFLIAW